MIIPHVEDLAQVLFAADGRDVARWLEMPEPQGGFVREHYRKLARVSIDWLTQTVAPQPQVSVTAMVTMSSPPPPKPEAP